MSSWARTTGRAGAPPAANAAAAAAAAPPPPSSSSSSSSSAARGAPPPPAAGRGRGAAARAAEKPQRVTSFEKPSARLDKDPFSSPFATNKALKTAFATAYQAGSIPCRVLHGSVSKSLQWDREVDTNQFSNLLVLCAEGLRETDYPFVFVARAAFKELLEYEGAYDLVLPVLAKLVQSVRAALMSSEAGVFEAALDALSQLSGAANAALNPHLHILLSQVNKKIFDRKLREKVVEVLNTLERNGGPASLPLIKSKVPTYTSISAF